MTRRVVIAEDEPAIVLSLEFLMHEAGFDVLTAENGAKALTLCRESRPDLLVLDVMLPMVNGFDVCREIRSDPGLQKVRILMLTARGGATEASRGVAAGADAYVTKPFGTQELMRIVDNLIGTGRNSHGAT